MLGTIKYIVALIYGLNLGTNTRTDGVYNVESASCAWFSSGEYSQIKIYTALGDLDSYWSVNIYTPYTKIICSA